METNRKNKYIYITIAKEVGPFREYEQVFYIRAKTKGQAIWTRANLNEEVELDQPFKWSAFDTEEEEKLDETELQMIGNKGWCKFESEYME